MAAREESSSVDGMSIRRQVFFQMENRLPLYFKNRGRTSVDLILRPVGVAVWKKSWLSSMRLCGEAVENTFDHKNGDIIAKTKFFRKSRRTGEDVVHERFRR
jgi:hypothetical protein